MYPIIQLEVAAINTNFLLDRVLKMLNFKPLILELRKSSPERLNDLSTVLVAEMHYTIMSI